MKTMIEVQSVAVKDGSATLIWKGEFAGRAVTTLPPTKASPQLLAAMEAIKPEYLKALRLPKEYGKGAELRKVDCDYNEDGELTGAHILLVKPVPDLSNSPLNLNSPPMRVPSESGEKGVGMPKKLIALLDDLAEAARLFVEERRAETPEQLGLFAGAASTNGGRPHTNRIDEITERRMRCALMELAPDAKPGEPIDDDRLSLLIVDRWEDVVYLDTNESEFKKAKWPGFHLHHYKDEDGEGDVWCFVEAKEVEDFITNAPTIRLRFWYGVQPDVFQVEHVLPTLVAAEILPIYRELLKLPAPEAVAAGAGD